MKKIDQIQDRINELLEKHTVVKEFSLLQEDLAKEIEANKKKSKEIGADVDCKHYKFVYSSAYKKSFDYDSVMESVYDLNLSLDQQNLLNGAITHGVDYEKLGALCTSGALPMAIRVRSYREELIPRILTKRI